MKKFVLALGLMTVALGAYVTPALADGYDFRIQNHTGATIKSIALKAEGDDDSTYWVIPKKGTSEAYVWSNGANVKITLPKKWDKVCDFHYQVVDAEGVAWDDKIVLCDKDNYAEAKVLEFGMDGKRFTADVRKDEE